MNIFQEVFANVDSKTSELVKHCENECPNEKPLYSKKNHKSSPVEKKNSLEKKTPVQIENIQKEKTSSSKQLKLEMQEIKQQISKIRKENGNLNSKIKQFEKENDTIQNNINAEKNNTEKLESLITFNIKKFDQQLADYENEMEFTYHEYLYQLDGATKGYKNRFINL